MARDHVEAVAELHRIYGDEGIELAASTPFDLSEINGALDGLGINARSPDESLPSPLAELVGAVRTSAGKRQLRRLIDDALAEPPGQVDAAVMEQMVSPFTWLLNRVGDGGITLTSAGYLPPAYVAAAMTDLGLREEWPGEGNRENLTIPILHLRESATKMGLLRKHRGRLVLTARGRSATADPSALWQQLAERMPVRSADAAETQAGLLLLVALAAQSTDDVAEISAHFLGAMDWASSDGTPLSGSTAGQAAWDTRTVLARLGAFARLGAVREWRDDWAAQLAPAGLAFVRAALRTWPSHP
ncbi:MAG: hypothetical protein ABJB47_15105 [Actinomycetota bacterium]